MIHRRRRTQYAFAAFLVILAAVNVLFLFILNRPARAEYASLQDSIKVSRFQITQNEKTIDSLEKTSEQLSRFDKDKSALLKQHLLRRNVGYSEIVTRLDALVQKSGVKKTRVTYSMSPTPLEGLSVVSITIPLEGSYTSVVNFVRELENSDTFFLITSIDLANSASSSSVSAAATGGVALSLAMETYFYQ
jgi:hypothetical protein